MQGTGKPLKGWGNDCKEQLGGTVWEGLRTIQEGNKEHRGRLLGTRQSGIWVVKLESVKEPNTE